MSTTEPVRKGRPLKVYGAITSSVPFGPLRDALIALGRASHVSQDRIIVSATTALAARESLGMTRGEWKHCACETNNAVEVGLGMDHPGQIFVAPLDGVPARENFIPVFRDGYVLRLALDTD